MLATIEKIDRVENHPNADRLDLVYVRGYQCVVPKGVWSEGGICVFIQPDTILPDAEWATFYKKSNRVKAIRLRGEWSFGIVESPEKLGLVEYILGDEVSEKLGISKYELPEPQNLDAKQSGLPFNIPKTNEERYQNLSQLPFGERVVITQKIDGQSATYYWKDGEFGVCGRRFEYKTDSKNKYTDHVSRYDLETKLRLYCEKHGVNIALRGESYGEGIQSSKYNPHSKVNNQIAFFSVWLIDEMRYASPFEEHSVFKVCKELDLPRVPVLYAGILTEEILDKYRNLDKLNGEYFEGVVVVGEGFSFKVISLEYDSRK